MPPKKKPGDDAPKPKKKSEPRTRNAPIDITNWRQQSQNRWLVAHPTGP
jgi:hypothetical protein